MIHVHVRAVQQPFQIRDNDIAVDVEVRQCDLRAIAEIAIGRQRLRRAAGLTTRAAEMQEPALRQARCLHFNTRELVARIPNPEQLRQIQGRRRFGGVSVIALERYADREFHARVIARRNSSFDEIVRVRCAVCARAGAVFKIQQHDVVHLPFAILFKFDGRFLPLASSKRTL